MHQKPTIVILTGERLNFSLKAAAECNNVYIIPKLADTIVRSKNNIQSKLKIIEFEELNLSKKIEFNSLFFMLSALGNSEVKLCVDSTQVELFECANLICLPHMKTINISIIECPNSYTVEALKKIALLTQKQRAKLKITAGNDRVLNGVINPLNAFNEYGMLSLHIDKQ